MKRRNGKRWVPSLQSSPTDERLAHAGKAYDTSDDKRGDIRIITMRDAPLERLHFRGRIDLDQYNAGLKFRGHWYRGGLDGLPSADLLRVCAGSVNFDHLARSESAEHHRRQFFAALRFMGRANGYLLGQVVCYEVPLHIVGASLGWPTLNQARTAATERVRASLDRLVELWT
jgi:hypothetical protein